MIIKNLQNKKIIEGNKVISEAKSIRITPKVLEGIQIDIDKIEVNPKDKNLHCIRREQFNEKLIILKKNAKEDISIIKNNFLKTYRNRKITHSWDGIPLLNVINKIKYILIPPFSFAGSEGYGQVAKSFNFSTDLGQRDRYLLKILMFYSIKEFHHWGMSKIFGNSMWPNQSTPSEFNKSYYDMSDLLLDRIYGYFGIVEGKTIYDIIYKDKKQYRESESDLYAFMKINHPNEIKIGESIYSESQRIRSLSNASGEPLKKYHISKGYGKLKESILHHVFYQQWKRDENGKKCGEWFIFKTPEELKNLDKLFNEVDNNNLRSVVFLKNNKIFWS